MTTAGFSALKRTVRSFHEALGGVRGIRLLALGLLLLACLTGYVLAFSKVGFWAYRERTTQVADLEARNLRLKDENTDLYHKIQAFREDPLARERFVREQLGWARPNELVIEFLPEAPKTGK